MSRIISRIISRKNTWVCKFNTDDLRIIFMKLSHTVNSLSKISQRAFLIELENTN